MSSVELSDWYQLVDGPELEQGDIFEDCPVFRIPEGLDYPPTEGAEVDIDVQSQDLILLTQSCDLVQDQKANIEFVTLCPFWKLSEVASQNPMMNSSYGKEMCRRGNMHAYHMLAECDHPDYQREIGIVSFREIVSLPLGFLRGFAATAGSRRRLRSPYREHLAQAFARYFMRVGLPVDIPSFGVQKDEEKAIQRLETLDAETRARVINSFSGG